MSSTHSVFLMYHELEMEGRPLCQLEPGYVRYILPHATFAKQMAWLKQQGIDGKSVTQTLDFASHPSVAITFDDGSETDLICAAPVLREAGFGATFYITTGFLGKRGYLSTAQLRELDGFGFEIGCHSMTHPYLSDIDQQQLETEITGAKQTLEQLLGHNIGHFSCPGGRYDDRTLETARRAGFRTVATSRYSANSLSTDRYRLGRVALLRDMNLDEFGELCRGRGLWKKRATEVARSTVRNLFGNTIYDRVRAHVLESRRH